MGGEVDKEHDDRLMKTFLKIFQKGLASIRERVYDTYVPKHYNN